jgi:fibrillarin-like pre-rRNA processing protein
VLLAIKARSINVVEAPSRVYERELEVLRGRGFEVGEVLGLEPFDRDHVMVVARYVK